MASGNEPNEDPTTRGPDPNWWQGAPEPDSPWQSNPQPTTPYTGGPYNPQPGPDPYQAQPYPGQGQPYPGQAQPYPGQPQQNQPYQSQPYQQSPYQSGPTPYQTSPPAPYGPQPGYGPPPPGGGGRKGWLIAGIGLLIVVIIGAVITVVLVNHNSSEPSAKSTTTPSLISALTPSNSAAPSGSKPSSAPKTTSGSGTTPAPVIPGYQVVAIPDNGAAYDIPTTWKVDTSGQTTFSGGNDSVPIAGLAQDGLEYCPNYVRTNVFLSQSTETDPAKAAADIGTRMGRIGWSTSTGATPGPAESFTSTDGQLQGIYMETKGSAPAPAAGCASTYSVYTFAFPGGNDGAFVFTIAADTGVANSVDATFAKKILASIRPM
ncbi:hypothetical protein [Nocardia sp. NPDC006630]|uniref:hypothetical protein n=1 Tax=Nocardia sp. NPDC006630 TaxID=3157181 RepID=UPI0033A7EDA4